MQELATRAAGVVLKSAVARRKSASDTKDLLSRTPGLHLGLGSSFKSSNLSYWKFKGPVKAVNESTWYSIPKWSDIARKVTQHLYMVLKHLLLPHATNIYIYMFFSSQQSWHLIFTGVVLFYDQMSPCVTLCHMMMCTLDTLNMAQATLQKLHGRSLLNRFASSQPSTLPEKSSK